MPDKIAAYEAAKEAHAEADGLRFHFRYLNDGVLDVTAVNIRSGTTRKPTDEELRAIAAALDGHRGDIHDLYMLPFRRDLESAKAAAARLLAEIGGAP